MNNVVIIDYEMGNLDSVARAVEECGGTPKITDKPKDLESATHIILPGVGSFAKGIKNLTKLNMVETIREQALNYRIPFLGICLGMQLLAIKGYEGGEISGIGLIKGEVVKLNKVKNEKIPHVGWNEISFIRDSPLFNGIKNKTDFYFVHSYYFKCESNENILAKTNYCGGFTSVIQKGNIFGVQFHPEKSQKSGFNLLSNFLKL